MKLRFHSLLPAMSLPTLAFCAPLLIAGLFACGDPNSGDPDGNTGEGEGEGAKSGDCSSAPKYNDVKGILSANCTSCHTAGMSPQGNVALDTFNGAKANAKDSESQVKSGAMPIGASLSNADKTKLLKWYTCGTPQ